MRNLIICCEGETEELFVEKILTPYLAQLGVEVTSKGMKGVSSYKQIKGYLYGYCQSYPSALVTTMIDYYKTSKLIVNYFKADKTITASINAETDIYKRAVAIEKIVEADMHPLENLMFNMELHEFEGYLFSHTAAFADIASKSQLDELANIRHRHETPEHINEKYETSPSRRIIGILPKYQKLQDGIPIAESITIDKIAAECRHFANWLAKLTAWAKGEEQ
ncbi:MAG: DUF4276 family protein [Lachnospiraceae bacterium]|nr:DUF4276 family protein [Lachnospiraceae bacterium]